MELLFSLLGLAIWGAGVVLALYLGYWLLMIIFFICIGIISIPIWIFGKIKSLFKRR